MSRQSSLGIICIVFNCCPVCDNTNLGINLNLLIKSLFYVPKKSKQKRVVKKPQEPKKLLT